MDLPFEVTFYQGNQQQPVKKFVKSLKELYDMGEEYIIEITENINTYLSVSGDEDVRLYMDGLEVLPEEYVGEEYVGEDEHGVVFLTPSSVRHPIYENKENNPYFPLIPGYYQICVVVNGEWFYSLFRIRTKQITEEQWKVMRDDIENSLSGLAQDLVRKNTSIVDRDRQTGLPNFILRKWHLIKRFKTRLIASIQDLTMIPRHIVRKEYVNVPRVRVRTTDSETVKFLQKYPTKKDTYRVPNRRVDIVVPENKSIKTMLISINQTLKEIKSYCDNYEAITQRKIDEERRESYGKDNGKITSLRLTLKEIGLIKSENRKLMTTIQRFLADSWIKEVPIEKNICVPFAVTMDQRYQVIYQLYNQLKLDHVTITVDPMYQYNWKRTDLLYELWSFIRVVRVFVSNEMGFSPIGGWLVDHYPNVPELLPSNKIVMKKDEITIQIVYGGEVLGTSKETTLENPIYTGAENRTPDCRIDYYDVNGFIGSLVLDFKYRPHKYIWDDSLIKKRSSNTVMRQLKNYRDSFKSKWYFKDRINPLLLRQMSPIREVWAVYPLQKNDKNIRYLNDYQICLIGLTPKEANRHFTERLQEVTDEMIKMSKLN